MKVLICGDRNWTDKEAIRRVLSSYGPDTVVIHGDNGKVDSKTGNVLKGADKIAGEVAKDLGFKVIAVAPKWDRYGRAAGPMRNREMFELKPDIVIAFHRDITKSKGTKDMITAARKSGFTTKVWAG